MEIYDKAINELDGASKVEMLNLYLAKTGEYYGVVRCRQLYERSFKILKQDDLVDLGLRFSRFERKLGEIDRSRGIY